MSATCYVCGSEKLIPDADPRNAVCEAHREARQHVISMQTGKMVCSCGWLILGTYSREDKDRFTRIHWESVCAGGVVVEGTS